VTTAEPGSGPESVVAVTDHVFPDLEIERRLLADAGLGLRYEGDARTPQEVLAAVAGAVGVLNCYTPIPAEVIDGLDEGCRVIARYGIGIDSIDVDAATRRGILVTNVPDYCIDEVSDHALALMLCSTGLGCGPATTHVSRTDLPIENPRTPHRSAGTSPAVLDHSSRVGLVSSRTTVWPIRLGQIRDDRRESTTSRRVISYQQMI